MADGEQTKMQSSQRACSLIMICVLSRKKRLLSFLWEDDVLLQVLGDGVDETLALEPCPAKEARLVSVQRKMNEIDQAKATANAKASEMI